MGNPQGLAGVFYGLFLRPKIRDCLLLATNTLPLATNHRNQVRAAPTFGQLPAMALKMGVVVFPLCSGLKAYRKIGAGLAFAA